jgi:hypothetical protein
VLRASFRILTDAARHDALMMRFEAACGYSAVRAQRSSLTPRAVSECVRPLQEFTAEAFFYMRSRFGVQALGESFGALCGLGAWCRLV